MTITYKPYEIVDGVYRQQIYPTNYPIATSGTPGQTIVNGVSVTFGTTPMAIAVKNITEFQDEPANKETFEYAGVFHDVPLFFMRANKAATMTAHVVCNAHSSLPIFLKYCNCWGKVELVEQEFLAQKIIGGNFLEMDTAGMTRSFYVTLEPVIKEKSVCYGRTQFDIDLKFTKIQI